MSPWPAVVTGVTFVWLGMVLGISFLEAPLKFRAPDVTLRIGLGIGRLVFRALNATEAAFALIVLVALVVHPVGWAVVAAAVAIAVLATQLMLVRPRLTARSNAVLADRTPPRSHAHHAYVALETVKATALLAGGIFLLASSP
jgi:hypothetical protein